MWFTNLFTDAHCVAREFVFSIALAFVMTDFPSKNVKEVIKYIGRYAFTVVARFVVMCVCGLILSLLGENGKFLFLASESIGNVVVACLYAIFFCSYNRRVRISSCMGIIVVSMICAGFSQCLGTLNEFFENIGPIIGYVMCIAFIVFYKLCAFEKFPEFSTSSSVFLIAVDLIGISSLYAIQFLDTERNMRNVYSLFVYIALYFIVITIYLSARSICSEKRRYLRAKQENLLIRATNSQIEMTKTNMASFRKMRHDIRNKIGVLLVLNQEKKYDELTRGLTELAGADIVEAGYIDCGNTEISAILTMEQSKAMANGFKLVHTVVVPSRLPFDIMDICSVLANMIDNAIEANLRYGVSDNICVQISIKGKYLYIGVLNKLPENFYKDEILNLSTSKANPEEHGFGVDIIRNISEKYGGFSSFDIVDGFFVAEAMIRFNG